MRANVSVDLNESYLHSKFDAVPSFTVGAEEELLLLDPDTGAPRSVADLALALFGGDPRLEGELRASQIEIVSPVCVAVPDVSRELSSVRGSLALGLAPDALVVASGAHPLAAEPGLITQRPRYEAIARDQPWAARHMLTCGLHVHVAVGGADRVLAVHNAMRSYLPEIVALGANAPFHDGTDTGLATARTLLNRSLSRSGVPPAFASWRELTAFLSWAARSATVPDATHLWWDIRLSLAHATLEIRAADVQTRVVDSAAIIAFVQCLVFELAGRYDAGERLPVHHRDRITEAVFVAARDGLAGCLPDLDTGDLVPASERLHELADRLRPAALELGCAGELDDVHRLVIEGGGAALQREIVASDGIDKLADELALRSAEPIGESCGAPSAVASRRQERFSMT